MTQERNAYKAMSRLLKAPPPLAPNVLPCGTQLTRRWLRDGFHGYAPGMPGCLVATYHGRGQDCAWTMEGRRLADRLRPGTVTVISHKHDGSWHLGGPVLVSHVYLSNERLRDCAGLLLDGKSLETMDRVGFRDPAASAILSLLSEEETLNDQAASLLVDRAVDLLCLQLLRHHSVGDGHTAPLTGAGLTPRQVRRAADFMTEHLDQPIRLETLAKQAGLSRYYFCTAFRLATTLTPHAWLTRQRILRARELLTTSELPIGAIASSVGYSTQSAFASVFRRLVGVTPSQYRRNG
jgi:AraC family transcriptional regulator